MCLWIIRRCLPVSCQCSRWQPSPWSAGTPSHMLCGSTVRFAWDMRALSWQQGGSSPSSQLCCPQLGSAATGRWVLNSLLNYSMFSSLWEQPIVCSVYSLLGSKQLKRKNGAWRMMPKKKIQTNKFSEKFCMSEMTFKVKAVTNDHFHQWLINKYLFFCSTNNPNLKDTQGKTANSHICEPGIVMQKQFFSFSSTTSITSKVQGGKKKSVIEVKTPARMKATSQNMFLKQENCFIYF